MEFESLLCLGERSAAGWAVVALAADDSGCPSYDAMQPQFHIPLNLAFQVSRANVPISVIVFVFVVLLVLCSSVVIGSHRDIYNLLGFVSFLTG